jgi:hypothetical protein
MRRLALSAVALAAAVAAGNATATAQPAAGDGLAPLLARISARVENFYSRARTVTARETVRLHQLENDFSTVGFARQLVYDLRLDWDIQADGTLPIEAKMLRHLMMVNGRPPRPKDEPECTDPESVSSDHLTMLLPQKRSEYEFTPGEPARLDNRPATTINFRDVSKDTPEVIWTEDCVRVSLPGRTRGRIWVDAENLDVLRIDGHLTRMFDFPTTERIARRQGVYQMALERYDFTIRYREVKFADPEETLTLPRLVETMSVWKGAATRRFRITQEYSDYRRFVTGGRIVAGDEVR